MSAFNASNLVIKLGTPGNGISLNRWFTYTDTSETISTMTSGDTYFSNSDAVRFFRAGDSIKIVGSDGNYFGRVYYSSPNSVQLEQAIW